MTKKKLHNIPAIIIQYRVYYIYKFLSSKEKVKLEDLVLDLTRNCTYIQKCALNATFLFASADGCIKTKKKENVTACLNRNYFSLGIPFLTLNVTQTET